jgi:hypothetical protein
VCVRAQRIVSLAHALAFSPHPLTDARLVWLGCRELACSASAVSSPHVAALQWWSKRGEYAQDRRVVASQLLLPCRNQWGRQVRPSVDRGYATAQWLCQLLEPHQRFGLRWKKGHQLLDRWGTERTVWEIARGQKTWGYRMLCDPHPRQHPKVGVPALLVTHPEHARPMGVGMARIGQGHEPWYWLTSDAVRAKEAAWEGVLAYAKRWQIATCRRSAKSELAIESLRVWTWEGREKVRLMVTLLYTHSSAARVLAWLVRYFCHCTGQRSWATHTPLSRLRSALSRLGHAHPPSRSLPSLNPG